MNDHSNLFVEEADMLLTILNQQRHDWLNHFQVLLGYLKLGRPEEGETYLTRVTELARQESLLTRINCPPLSSFFLTFHALHNDLCLEVELYNDIDLSKVQKDQLSLFQFIYQLIMLVKNSFPKGSMETNSLLVTLESLPEAIQIQLELSAGLPASAQLELEKLLESELAQGVTIQTRNQREEEWCLELNLPYRM
ncbi:Spo0B domain-containing protein [Brevibacillus ginsengisoli]|uniref:Spo0B domain-containing protein n=1 Tax=Brevibacillus ginsengisoli TaxID=363854 RepID=UPI003CEE7BD3